MSDDESGPEGLDEGQRGSQERDTATPPAANPSLDMDNDDNMSDDGTNESDLSDIDEAQFEDFDPANIAIEDRPAIAVDETNIGLIGVHKRKRADVDDGGAKKKREHKRVQPKKSRKAKDDDNDDLSAPEEITGKRQRKKRATTERKERPRARKATPVNEEELTPEERRRRALDKAMDEALKNPNRRRRKIAGEDLEKAQDALIENVRQRMVNAAMADNDARKEGRVAGAKLKLLPEVVGLLNRNNLHHHLADPDSGIIEAMKFFLEPLSDGSLPAYNVQREMFTALTNLPINQDTLIQSGIGKVTLFYTKSKRPQAGIKRMAEKLLGEWTRPILKRSADYKQRVHETVDYDPTKTRVVDSSNIIKETMAEIRRAAQNPQRNPNRAARVVPDAVSYEIAPKNIGLIDGKATKRIGANEEAWLRRLKAKHAGRVTGRG